MSDRSNAEPAEGRDAISRREFVLARFFRHRSAKLAAQANQALAPRRATETMRYPQSLADVAAGDPLGMTTGKPVPLENAAARRRIIPVFRPPGAIDEQHFLSGCTRCEACIKACPFGAIVHAPLQFRSAAGTPTIEAD